MIKTVDLKLKYDLRGLRFYRNIFLVLFPTFIILGVLLIHVSIFLGLEFILSGIVCETIAMFVTLKLNIILDEKRRKKSCTIILTNY